MIAMCLFVVVSLLSISHVGSVANTAECYTSEEILDCRGDGIQYFSGEIDPSISRVLMNHIMKSEQIENVRVKATCVFELSMSNKELCDTVEGKIIVVNGEECLSYDTAIETHNTKAEELTPTEKISLGISTTLGVKEIEEEEGNTTYINGLYSNEGTESPRKWIIVVVCLSVFSFQFYLFYLLSFFCTYCKKRKPYYHVNSIELKRVPSITSHLSSEVEFCVLNERKQK